MTTTETTTPTYVIRFVHELREGDVIAPLIDDDYEGPRTSGTPVEVEPTVLALAVAHAVESWDGSNLTLRPTDAEPYTLHLVDPMDVVARRES